MLYAITALLEINWCTVCGYWKMWFTEGLMVTVVKGATLVFIGYWNETPRVWQNGRLFERRPTGQHSPPFLGGDTFFATEYYKQTLMLDISIYYSNQTNGLIRTNNLNMSCLISPSIWGTNVDFQHIVHCTGCNRSKTMCLRQKTSTVSFIINGWRIQKNIRLRWSTFLTKQREKWR